MLIGPAFGPTEPATGFRRRFFLYCALVSIVGGTLIASAQQAEPRGAPVATAVLRRSSATAIGALREHAPGAARLVERLVAEAEIVTADETSAPPWERYPGRTEAAWTRVHLEAHRALVELGERRHGFARGWEEIRDMVGTEVEKALAEANEAGVARREMAAAKQAQFKWLVAERFAGDGAFDRALVEAEQARRLATVVHDGFSALHARFGDSRNLAKWRRMVEETVAASRLNGAAAMVVDKLKRKLHLYAGGERLATFDAELGAKGLRQKMHAGDQATPEGRYRVSQVKGEGRTRYYKALLLNYPNDEDRARYAWGQRVGQVPLRTGIGSLIEIHGDGGQGRDWTDGCVALTNDDMDQIFRHARTGTPVTIVGTF